MICQNCHKSISKSYISKEKGNLESFLNKKKKQGNPIQKLGYKSFPLESVGTTGRMVTPMAL